MKQVKYYPPPCWIWQGDLNLLGSVSSFCKHALLSFPFISIMIVLVSKREKKVPVGSLQEKFVAERFF